MGWLVHQTTPRSKLDLDELPAALHGIQAEVSEIRSNVEMLVNWQTAAAELAAKQVTPLATPNPAASAVRATGVDGSLDDGVTVIREPLPLPTDTAEGTADPPTQAHQCEGKDPPATPAFTDDGVPPPKGIQCSQQMSDNLLSPLIHQAPVEHLPFTGDSLVKRNQLENSELRKSSFEKIYTNKIWTDVKDPNDDTPLSGDGSRIDTARPAMKGLVAVLLALHSKSQRRVRLLDAACGDLTWMPTVLTDPELRGKIHYTGADIADFVIRKHQANTTLQASLTEAQQTFNFIQLDMAATATDSAVVAEGFDLVLLRHMLMHNTLNGVKRIIAKSVATATYLFATTSPSSTRPDWVEMGLINAEQNLESEASRYRPRDLEAWPFCMPKPLCYQEDKDGPLGLWKLQPH